MLPSWDFFQHQKSNFIAAIKKVPRLGIMGCPHDIAMQVLPKNYRIATLCPRGHRLSYKWKSLMAIESPQLDDLPVERESVVRECRLAKPNPARIFIDYTTGLEQSNVNCI
jgi:hypothetical protein